MPAVTVRFPFVMVWLAVRVAVPADLLTVTSRNVVVALPPMVWAPVPLNVTVTALPDMLTAALLVQLPATLKLTVLLS